jgi:D-alanine transaminase
MPHPTLAFVNGQFVPIDEAKISILDRGFLFADGCYEVSAVIGGRLIDNSAHMARLERSLRELEITPSIPVSDIPGLMQELVKREALDEGMVYLQITRGADSFRDFGYPDPAKVPASLVMFVQAKRLRDNELAQTGGKVITIPEIRWQRRDIKSVALLPQAMGKQEAIKAGAVEAWMIEDGYITEATAAAVGIITAEKKLITRSISGEILDSVTRRAVLELLTKTDLEHEPRPFTPAEAYAATEAFIASATALITPIIQIDDHRIGTGKPGPYVRQLRELYLASACDGDPTITRYDYRD